MLASRRTREAATAAEVPRGGCPRRGRNERLSASAGFAMPLARPSLTANRTRLHSRGGIRKWRAILRLFLNVRRRRAAANRRGGERWRTLSAPVLSRPSVSSLDAHRIRRGLVIRGRRPRVLSARSRFLLAFFRQPSSQAQMVSGRSSCKCVSMFCEHRCRWGRSVSRTRSGTMWRKGSWPPTGRRICIATGCEWVGGRPNRGHRYGRFSNRRVTREPVRIA